MFKGVIVAEGSFEGLVEFETYAELEAYSKGFSRAANLYGAGSCGVWTDAEYGDLVGCADPDSEEDSAMLALLKKYFG